MDAIFRIGTVLAFAEEHGGGGHEGGHHLMSFLGLIIYMALVIGIIFALMSIAKPGISKRVSKNAWTQRFEQLYGFIESMCVGIIGPHGRKYVPMMLTFWCVIFISNVVALFFPTSPTADLSFNLGLALVSIAYVQYEGIRAHGAIGHISHFAGPKMVGAMVLVNLLIFPIELISELMKNVSLSLRLYGNIDGGHKAVVAMNELGHAVIGPLSIPFGFFLLPIKALTCVVQALIFTLLTCVYLSLVTQPHEHDDEHGHDEAHGDHGHAGQVAPAH